MELEIIKNEKDYLEIKIKGEDYGLPNALKELLLEDGSVEFAAYRMDHPQAEGPVLMIRTSKGSPVAALKSAIKRMRKFATDLKDEMKGAKKKK